MKTRIRAISEIVYNKSVLHVGFADACFDPLNPHEYVFRRKMRMGIWLHDHLVSYSNRCAGIDTDKVAVDLLKQMGYINVHSDYNSILGMEFDYLVLGEIIEHIDNPVEFLKGLKKMFPNSKIIATVPNALKIENFINCLFGKEIINEDHRYWFTPFTINKIMERSGYIGNTELIESSPRGIIKTLVKTIFPYFRDIILFTT